MKHAMTLTKGYDALYRIITLWFSCVNGIDLCQDLDRFLLFSLGEKELGRFWAPDQGDGHQQSWEATDQHKDPPAVELKFIWIIGVIAKLVWDDGPRDG